MEKITSKPEFVKLAERKILVVPSLSRREILPNYIPGRSYRNIMSDPAKLVPANYLPAFRDWKNQPLTNIKPHENQFYLGKFTSDDPLGENIENLASTYAGRILNNQFLWGEHHKLIFNPVWNSYPNIDWKNNLRRFSALIYDKNKEILAYCRSSSTTTNKFEQDLAMYKKEPVKFLISATETNILRLNKMMVDYQEFVQNCQDYDLKDRTNIPKTEEVIKIIKTSSCIDIENGVLNFQDDSLIGRMLLSYDIYQQAYSLDPSNEEILDNLREITCSLLHLITLLNIDILNLNQEADHAIRQQMYSFFGTLANSRENEILDATYSLNETTRVIAQMIMAFKNTYYSDIWGSNIISDINAVSQQLADYINNLWVLEIFDGYVPELKNIIIGGSYAEKRRLRGLAENHVLRQPYGVIKSLMGQEVASRSTVIPINRRTEIVRIKTEGSHINPRSMGHYYEPWVGPQCLPFNSYIYLASISQFPFDGKYGARYLSFFFKQASIELNVPISELSAKIIHLTEDIIYVLTGSDNDRVLFEQMMGFGDIDIWGKLYLEKRDMGALRMLSKGGAQYASFYSLDEYDKFRKNAKIVGKYTPMLRPDLETTFDEILKLKAQNPNLRKKTMYQIFENLYNDAIACEYGNLFAGAQIINAIDLMKDWGFDIEDFQTGKVTQRKEFNFFWNNFLSSNKCTFTLYTLTGDPATHTAGGKWYSNPSKPPIELDNNINLVYRLVDCQRKELFITSYRDLRDRQDHFHVYH